MIHPLALVESKKIGNGTKIWAFVHILENAEIGENCNICDHCYIEYNVKVGDNVTIKSGVYIWENTHLEDDVFIGPNVVFTNNPRPRSKKYIDHLHTRIKTGASVGANSTILAGVTIGKYSMIGMGSVVTRDVPDYALVYGNPAKLKGWVNEDGDKLQSIDNEKYIDNSGQIYQLTLKGLIKL